MGICSEKAMQRFDDPCVRDIDCCDPADLTAGLLEWKWDLTRLAGGDFSARAVAIPLGALLLTRLKFNRALLHCVRAPLGCVSLLLFGSSSGAVFVDGRRLETQDCLVVDAHSAVEIVSHHECIVVAISLSEHSWSRATRLSLADGTALRGGSRLVTCGSQCIEALLNASDLVVEAFTLSSACDVAPSLRSWCAELVLTRLLEVHKEPQQLHGAQHGRARRVIGVQRARDYILDHLSDPISLSDLCRQTHMQARSLEYGFREIVGLSPVSYIKMMRLGVVHRRLLSTANYYRSISELALDNGFWHLSQFAVDYKKLFKESPSATRARIASLQRKSPTREAELSTTSTADVPVSIVATSVRARAREAHAAFGRV
jgi:AraC family transcriptional regulator, ethanolamine operon transcriptional activator